MSRSVTAKNEPIHVINPRISDNKTKTDSTKISYDLFNPTEAIEEAISNNREKVHTGYIFADIPETNKIVEQEKFIDMASTKQGTHTKSASNTDLILGDLSILYERMIVNLKEDVRFKKSN